MKKNTLNSLLLFAVMIAASACKTKKAVVAVPKPADTAVIANTGKSENIKMLRAADLSFNTLALKARADMSINGNNNNVTMNIRIQKDQKIWVSITAIAGIEVARALITPDSIKVRNNFQSVYLRKPFSYVYRYTSKQVDFSLLQAIFSGNTVPAFMKEDAELILENGVWELKGKQEDLAYGVLFNTLLKVAENDLNDVKTGQALKVEYRDYQKLNDALFPSGMKINSMAGKQRISIDLDFSKIERNVPLEFPFTVPGKYEVIN